MLQFLFYTEVILLIAIIAILIRLFWPFRESIKKSITKRQFKFNLGLKDIEKKKTRILGILFIGVLGIMIFVGPIKLTKGVYVWAEQNRRINHVLKDTKYVSQLMSTDSSKKEQASAQKVLDRINNLARFEEPYDDQKEMIKRFDSLADLSGSEDNVSRLYKETTNASLALYKKPTEEEINEGKDGLRYNAAVAIYSIINETTSRKISDVRFDYMYDIADSAVQE